MNGPLAGKKALISGGAGGIGLAAARALAQTGCDLTISGRGAGALEDVAATLRKEFSVAIETEVSNPAIAVDAEALAIACDDINVFISCTGNLPAGPMGAINDLQWRRSWEAALFSPINLIRELWAYMFETEQSLIVVVIDAAMQSDPDDVCASTAGGALMSLVEALGKTKTDGAPHILGLVTGRGADAASVGAAISRIVCEPERWTSGSLLSPDAINNTTNKE